EAERDRAADAEGERAPPAQPRLHREHGEEAERHVAEHVGHDVEAGDRARERRRQERERRRPLHLPPGERMQARVDHEHGVGAEEIARERRCAQRGHQKYCVPSHHAMPAMNAEPGMVKSHAQTMLPATPQRTALKLRAEPTPTIEPVIVCVVDTGIPRPVATNSVIAPLAEAQKPPTGLSLVMRMPMVLTMRQPPNSVPRPIAAWHTSTTQKGKWSGLPCCE